ncbi:capsular polysaccharide export protein [Sphingobium fontiphilum]|uniref:Capsular polysaccharide export protein n=2 Tax=Sphingobium fontiphilum TaxID=944425 RepID=A0A7W6GQ22_9SPHN|nr:beta-3-deoxy-D-manno-oct-2-ulosonic acid transferase [Sphingobium fontiphilum]MBB3981619.1 capsular polysaccharide export protein [Sphingobium fontiphilum]
MAAMTEPARASGGGEGPPFLRSPPFPGVAASIAAISLPIGPDDPREPVEDALLDRITQARVGGAFWRDDPWARIAVADCIHACAQDDDAIIAGLLGVPVIGPDGAPVPADALREAARARIGAARYRDCFTGQMVDAAAAVEQLALWRNLFDRNRRIAAVSGMTWWKRRRIRQFLWDGRRSPPSLSPAAALDRAAAQGGAVAVWPSRVPAAMMSQAQDRGVPFIRVEDGFLRSRGLGAALHPPSSIVVDRAGLYYDARSASDLEMLLATTEFSDALLARAERLRQRIVATGANKYGLTGDQLTLSLPAGRRIVLAVGQVEDDLSVRFGGAGIAGNLDFLRRVRAVEPDAYIIYRPHPDVVAGYRRGHVEQGAALALADCVDADAPLMPLLNAVDTVHVLSSLTGFEALLRGRDVAVHGQPFFAGWGLTRDFAPLLERRVRKLGLDQLVAGTLILYPRYIDPVTDIPCSPEILVGRIGDGHMPSPNWLSRVRGMQGALQRMWTVASEKLRG